MSWREKKKKKEIHVEHNKKSALKKVLEWLLESDEGAVAAEAGPELMHHFTSLRLSFLIRGVFGTVYSHLHTHEAPWGDERRRCNQRSGVRLSDQNKAVVLWVLDV